VDLQKLCLQVNDLCRETAVFIRSERAQWSDDKVSEKGINNFVTTVDTAVEALLVEKLSILLPGSGFIAEEGTATEHGETYQWIIDPIDGTTNFIHNLPCYAISIALKQDEAIVLGVVYEVNQDECFYSWKGGKAHLNDTEIQASDTPKLNESLLAMGFPYDNAGLLDTYMALFKELIQSSRGLRRIGSAAVDLAYVASGRFDAFYEYGLNSWDVAAGAFIVQQAGGLVSDFNGSDNFLFGGQIVAANSEVHEELRQIIDRHMPD